MSRRKVIKPHDKTAVLYRGTGCSKSFMNKVAKVLITVGGFKKHNISNRCWIKTGFSSAPHFHTKKSIAYLDVKHYNIKKGNFDFVAGHSAGGFPASLTKGKVRIGFNPFFTQYPFLDIIYHAKDDWLVIKDRPDLFEAKKLIVYKGRHGTFPRKQFSKFVKDTYQELF